MNGNHRWSNRDMAMGVHNHTLMPGIDDINYSVCNSRRASAAAAVSGNSS